jgi:hypothetical protein
MNDADGDMGAMAWPGFVDILSAVIIMFVFFVMVIVVVLYIYTIKFTATVEAQAEQRIQQTVESISKPEVFGDLEEQKQKKIEEIQVLEEQKIEVQKQLDSLQGKVEQLSVGMEDSVDQKTIVNDREIIVMFDVSSVTLTEDSIGQVQTFLKNVPAGSTLTIEASDDPNAVVKSNTRQLGLARMLNIRNVALESDYTGSQMEMNYVEAEEIDGRFNWVKLKVRER